MGPNACLVYFILPYDELIPSGENFLVGAKVFAYALIMATIYIEESINAIDIGKNASP